MRIGKAKHIDVRLKNGPFNDHVIKMSIGQSETLVFRIGNGEYGSYKKHEYGNYANWKVEEAKQ